MSKKLSRIPTRGKIAGVCAGLAEHFGWDVTIVRFIVAALILFGGVSFWFYILAWLLMPVNDDYDM